MNIFTPLYNWYKCLYMELTDRVPLPPINAVSHNVSDKTKVVHFPENIFSQKFLYVCTYACNNPAQKAPKACQFRWSLFFCLAYLVSLCCTIFKFSTFHFSVYSQFYTYVPNEQIPTFLTIFATSCRIFVSQIFPEAKNLSRALVMGNNIIIMTTFVVNPPFHLITNIWTCNLQFRYPDSHCDILQLEHLQTRRWSTCLKIKVIKHRIGTQIKTWNNCKPLDDLLCASCKRLLLRHLIQHNQDHVPRAGMFLQAIPMKIHMHIKLKKGKKVEFFSFQIFCCFY